MIRFDTLAEFDKDLKRLVKRYRSLPDDLEVLKKVLCDRPGHHPPFSYRIEGLGLRTVIIKVKKIACRSLKGKGVNSGLRLVYGWMEQEERMIFIELYHKSDQALENRERILAYFD